MQRYIKFVDLMESLNSTGLEPVVGLALLFFVMLNRQLTLASVTITTNCMMTSAGPKLQEVQAINCIKELRLR